MGQQQEEAEDNNHPEWLVEEAEIQIQIRTRTLTQSQTMAAIPGGGRRGREGELSDRHCEMRPSISGALCLSSSKYLQIRGTAR